METTPANLQNAEEYADKLARGPFQNYRVGVLHGKMRAKDREAIMQQFASGEIQLLVSTTVIEVGVDVPNAVIMMVENAERFGLSQLHQLRGRVGRGSVQSYCILISDTQNPDTKQRLQVLHQTNDGFKVAEYDLKARGPGDFLGKRQHGLPQLKIADLSSSMDTMEQVQQAAAADSRAPAFRRRKSAFAAAHPAHSLHRRHQFKLGCSLLQTKRRFRFGIVFFAAIISGEPAARPAGRF